MVLVGINQSHILREDTFIYSGTWYMVPWYNHIILLWSLLCQFKKHSININTTLSKMPGVTSEVCSDKSWTYVLTFDIWHVTFDIKTFAHLNFWTFEHLNIWTFEHLNIWTLDSNDSNNVNIWSLEHWNIETLEHYYIWKSDIQ